MIWKVGGKIRQLPASIETALLKLCKTLHFMTLFSSSSSKLVAIVKLFKRDATEAYLIWSCAT